MDEQISRGAAQQLIEALYRTLLGRAPDRYGLDQHLDEIFERGGSIENTIEIFLRSEEFAAKHQTFVARYVGGQPLRLTNDSSQYGETEILIRLMVNAAARHRIVVDAGARGRDGSNSFDLLKHFGWRGLLIEANPGLIPELRRDFAGLNVEIVNAAVSNRVGKAQFFLGENPDVSSLTRQFVENWGSCTGAIEVEVERLGSILDRYGMPPDFDVLSLDVEGEDVKVLNDLVSASDYRPLWIIIEASQNFAVTSLQDLDLCAEARREYAILGQTPANLVLGRMANGASEAEPYQVSDPPTHDGHSRESGDPPEDHPPLPRQ